MTDKKLNVLDRILLVFKPKKEICPDILSQADGVIAHYIEGKNRMIHRKCKKDTAGDTLFTLAMMGAVVLLGIVIFRSFA